MNNITGTAASQVRTGLSGPAGVWNAGIVRAAASRAAQDANAELAAREAKRLAATLRSLTDEAVKNLKQGIDDANNNFREDMDATFVVGGQWKKSGKNYIKDVIVYSTFIDPVITERKTVESYKNYTPNQPIEVRIDASEEQMAALDALSIQVIINSMYAEIQKLRDDIFGGEADNSGDGYFGIWVGHAPLMRADANAGMGKKEIFDDEGAGELGRLMAEFYYWNVKETQGIAFVNAASWDKPLWDSRDSWFAAPSLRSLGDITTAVVGTIVSTAVSAVATPVVGAAVNWAINMADDVQYTMLDVMSGNKHADEAFFDLSKKAAMTGTSSLIGLGFGSISSSIAASAVSGVDKVVAQTAVAGMQAVTTSTATSTLGAVTYSRDAGFGFSAESLNQGMKGGLVSALGGMTSTFTRGMMNAGLKGFTGDIYDNGTKLSGLAGGLAGEGVNYAFNGDFTLNTLNLAGFTNGKYNLGLLEMHLGNDGFSMNIGTTGVDASVGTIASAAKGLEAWKVNAEIWTSKEEEARKYASQLRTLYSGNDINRAEYEAMLSEKTNVVEDRNVKDTQSVSDGKTKTIILGSDALDIGSQFGLNVVFSHESYRNGLDDGAEGQRIETDTAAMGHIATANALISTYGLGAIGLGMAAEALSYNRVVQTNNPEGIADILGKYDSSGDYWKLITRSDGTHKLEWDDNKYLTTVFQARGEDGAWEDIKTKQEAGWNNKDKWKNITFGQSLVQILGEDRASDLLKANGIYSHFFDTLTELSDAERQQKLGERLMTNQGMSFNGTWQGTSAFLLTDNIVDGYILTNRASNGMLDKYTVSATLERRYMSYESKQGLGVVANAANNKALDAILFAKKDLAGNQIDAFWLTNVQSVDVYNLYDKDHKVNRDQPTDYKAGSESLQGNTVISDFSLRIDSLFAESYIMTIQNARTLDGYFIGSDGQTRDKNGNVIPGGAWRVHDSPYQVSDGCFITNTSELQKLKNTLIDWGVKPDDEIKGILHDTRINSITKK
jgi:hypothetical protein